MPHQEFFYVRPQDVGEEFLFLQKEEIHYLVHVHRKKVGDRFLAVDGQGTAYECLLYEMRKDFLRAKIVKKHRRLGEPVCQLSLGFALPKKERFGWVIEKGTELGISKFIPILTKRSVVNEKSAKPDRWARIALAAMKQCGRSFLPSIEPIEYFEVLCENSSSYGLKLIAHEKTSSQNLTTIFNNLSHLGIIESGILLIGPEGGFTNEEVEKALDLGFHAFRLGPRRLRAETAAIVAAALVLDKMGELN